MVSTHAPARGATSVWLMFASAYSRFNPRTRTGCDPDDRGGNNEYVSFNPRTRTGCDFING